jgi:hypothetical protein
MHDHNKTKEHNHTHNDCCGHDHGHDHGHAHDHAHDYAHNHAHDHGHGHKHMSGHDCSALVNKAQGIQDQAEATALFLEAGCGFAHLGDATGTAAVCGLVDERIKTGSHLNQLQTAQLNALKALSQALNKSGSKEALAKCVEELENFSGSEREHVEQLLGEVRKALASMRNSGLKALLSKFKF